MDATTDAVGSITSYLEVFMSAHNKTQFGSKAACTRGDVFIYLHRANGSPTVKIKNWFLDLKRTCPHYKAVL